MGVENKIILVTGASQGIGKACALKLAKHGAKVVIAARSKDKLDAVAADAEGDVLAVSCDASDPASVDALYKAIANRHGRLDVLFNNAGNNHPGTDFGDLEFENWRKVVGLNLDGAFLMANRAYRMMRDQSPKGGRIINNGSISAHAPRPGSAPYTASKHGITGLTKTISLDGRKHDIACCQIDIGNALTEMAARMADGVPQADGEIKKEPLMDVDVVADTILYMAGLDLSANAQTVTIMATKMPFVGRG
ncbi:SDR family oxidoreductase [Acuticoccus sp. MNP-M23]|uniref:SDR family oxidoreductase n=1 Tax=Acuticoccus sp. MNP-M23 TaxID=3072793 RepID=UPI002816325C|nr:SDR family oxidoreductase [Acuticoccus sp. MNP-M23]WMS42123.1 SDR family oxidoreductase [Acuticoccus sp. MNP-M23]